MAGSYPNVPSRKMAQDADGTVLLQRRNIAVMSEASQADMTEINDEDDVNTGISTGDGNGTSIIHWIFPELREFDGAFHSGSGSGSMDITTLETSGDTTNGIDGTFTERTTDLPNHFSTFDLYRDNIISYAVSNVRCVRVSLFGGGSGGAKVWRSSHLYGEISAGQTPDRLLWIDEITGLEYTLPIDYGDVPRGSARDRQCRLKNNSATLTASTLQITAEALFLLSGAWYTFDVAGGGFVATNSDITSLGAAATSGLITIRQIIPDSEVVGVHVARAFVSVASWA